MKMVMIDELLTGMVLAEAVIGKYDLVYACEDEEVTESMIEGFERLEIPYVFIKEDNNLEFKLSENMKSPEFQAIMRNYSEMLDLMDHVFRDFHFLDKRAVSTIEDPMDELVESVTSNTSLLLKLKRLYLKDEYSLTHSVHVSLLAAMIGKWNGMSDREIKKIALAGLFHDLGKSKIPLGILNKPGRLADHEMNVMKRHSELGYEIAKTQDVFESNVLRGIIEHHERMDGTGYPFGLKEDQIHPYAQVIAIADVYDAMTTERSYKNSESPFVAVDVIKDLSYKNHLNPKLVSKFLKNIYRLYIGAEVVLSSGQVGEIVYINNFAPEKPLVLLETGIIDLSAEPHVFIEKFKTD